jgi:hypothetical protein
MDKKYVRLFLFLCTLLKPSYTVDFEVNGMRKQVNEVQKGIAQKKKVRSTAMSMRIESERERSEIGERTCRRLGSEEEGFGCPSRGPDQES